MLIMLGVLVLLAGGFLVWGWAVSFEPKPVSVVPVISDAEAPKLKVGQSLKVLSWNIQFLAGKGHVFFFDLPGNKGPDEMPSQADIERTLPEVVRIIKDENPDVILLQEVDEGARRTYHQDQLQRILALLPKEYSQNTSAYYWKMPFVPHPRILGSVGMKLSIISRYKINSALRYSLPQAPYPPVARWFQFRRAMLEARLAVEDGSELVVMDAHLDAFIKTSELKKQETAFLAKRFAALDSLHTPWIFGADMNMLPPGFYARTPKAEQYWFRPDADAGPLYASFNALPTLAGLTGPDSLRNRTHFPNRPDATGLDKTIDFMFYANSIAVDSFTVRQDDCLKISDHMPIIARFRLHAI